MDTSILLAVAAVLVVIYLLKWFSFWSKLPPGPPGLPFVGYLPFLGRKPHLEFQRLAQKYGSVFGLKMGSAYVVVLNDFESTKETFSKEEFIGRPPEFAINFNKETQETNAFNGPPWKEQRKFLLHRLRDLGFGRTRMEGHITEEIDELLEHLEQQEGKPFSLYELLAPSMSNNISSLVFGKRLKYDNPDRQMMTRVIRQSASAIGQAVWHIFFPTLKKIFLCLGIGDVNKVMRIQKELKDYINKDINEHQATLDPKNIRDLIDGYLVEIEKRKDPCFCEPVLQDLVFGFFAAGSETVRLSVEWLVLTAAHYQDGQRRIQREIDDMIGRNQILTYMDHKSMPYTQAFIMELMRWRTIIPLIPQRYAITDGEIGNYFIPKSTHIIVNNWAIHHNQEYWGKDAEEFKPERFLTENGQEVKKWEHHIPFSVGTRACPGEPLAKIEIFLYFVSILRKFNVRLPDGAKADFEGDLGIGYMPRKQELIFTKRI